MYYAMSLDAGVCYDESELCVKKANAGKCINSALHEVANFCKKACGLCGIYIGLLFTLPPHEVQAGTLRDGDVHLFFFRLFFVCSSVFLSPETRTQNAVFSKTKQFTAMVSVDDVQEAIRGLFK